MDLSKAYDYLKDDLLLPKLQAYGFSKESIRLFLTYLTNRTQSIKRSSTFSDSTNIAKGIPQGFRLGSCLLIFLSIICSFFQENVKSVILLVIMAFLFLWYEF